MFDSHCHLDRDELAADLPAVIARARAAGVVAMIAPGVRPATWPALAALGARFAADGVAIAIGVHPQLVPDLAPDERPADLAAAIAAGVEAARAAGATVCAIGECGLDGATLGHAAQVETFLAHIRAARALRLPLIVHSLRRHGGLPQLLRDAGAAEVGGVMHSYSGPAEMIREYAALNFAFSFAGPVTWPGARKPLEAARAVPAELLLAETDAPDQAPHPHRGARTEPAMLGDVIAALAAVRGAEPGDIAALTMANARRVFPLVGCAPP